MIDLRNISFCRAVCTKYASIFFNIIFFNIFFLTAKSKRLVIIFIVKILKLKTQKYVHHTDDGQTYPKRFMLAG